MIKGENTFELGEQVFILNFSARQIPETMLIFIQAN